jgi:hypothetical protein
MQKIQELAKPKMNMQVLQGLLLKFKVLNRFVQRHTPSIAVEVGERVPSSFHYYVFFLFSSSFLSLSLSPSLSLLVLLCVFLSLSASFPFWCVCVFFFHEPHTLHTLLLYFVLDSNCLH